MKVQVVIPAAGSGERLKSPVAKPLVLLHNKPIIIYTLLVFEQCSLIDSVVLVVQEDLRKEIQKFILEHGLTKVRTIVQGGKTRFDSVFNGLQSIDSDTDIVVIHDAARPLLSVEVLEKAIEYCKTEGAVVVGVPAKSTIKRVNVDSHTILETLNRQELWEIQTPQIFDKKLIVEAYQQGDSTATDDAAVVERVGKQVKIFHGEYSNIKITTHEDVAFAKMILCQLKPE